MKVVLFDKAVATADGVVGVVQGGQFGLPTPYVGWTVGDVLNEMVAELAVLPDYLLGNRVDEESSRAYRIGGNVLRTWQALAETAQKAIELAPANQKVRLSETTSVPAVSFVEDVARTLILHTWDIAQGLGVNFHIDEETARALYAVSQGKVTLLRRKGLAGPELPVPPNATNEAKLLALFGRGI